MTRPGENASLAERLVSQADAGTRLDVFLASQFPQYSRVQIRRAINCAAAEVDGRRTKASYRLAAGERVAFTMPQLPYDSPQPENIPLEILHEDDCLIAVHKPAGMVVHPAKGHWQGTLTAALAFHFKQLSGLGGPTRPGIVHRLDRDSSGVLVVAKTDDVHRQLAAQFEARTASKEYFALVAGRLDRDRDLIEQPIGAHPYHRERMAIRANHPSSRDASTFYEVSERFDGFCALEVRPRTGRTHQIRVHLAHIGCPVLCDRLYGGRSQLTKGELAGQDNPEVLLDRQALHARRLTIVHPSSREEITFEAPLPADLVCVMSQLRTHRGVNS